ncbi:MAG: hypothetical protein WBA57_03790, partial [Elainellaceae cyanobacterium]
PVDDFSVVIGYDDIISKNYSLSAGQYFEVKIDYIDISQAEFDDKIADYQQNLSRLFIQSKSLEGDIQNSLKTLINE